MWKEDLIRAFYEGKRSGLRSYAWWKDGEEQVGTCGRTLKQAFDDVDEEERLALRGQDVC